MNKNNKQQLNKTIKNASLRGGTTKQSQAENDTVTNYKTSSHSGGGETQRTRGISSSNLKQGDIALKVNNVSKIFKIPHKKIDSMRSAFVNSFNKKTYEKFYALKDIDFEVQKGEFLGIIGHNGAGKSTLLKILAGVYQPSVGSIEINGMISPFLELGIGFNPELSGHDNVYLNATVLGLSQEQIDQKYQEIVEFAELENFMDEQLKNYSSGMQARLAFSVSIHADREILIMDEVLAVGDNRFQAKCLNIFKGYKNQGKTVILVTHGIDTVREYCDRALLLHKGELLGSGDVNEVCDEYILANMTEDQRRELAKKERLEKEEKKRIEAEEKRIQKEQKKQKTKKQKQKNMKITNIKLLDANNNELTTLTRGDDFGVEVTVDVNRKNKNYIVAVQVFDNSNDVFLSGNNTFEDEFDCGWNSGENVFKIGFENTMFNIGEIYIKVAIFDSSKKEDNIVDMISTKELNNKIITIKKQSGAGGGVMRIEHKWERIKN